MNHGRHGAIGGWGAPGLAALVAVPGAGAHAVDTRADRTTGVRDAAS